MRTSALIEGLTIIEKYRDVPDGFNTEAEHDVIHVYATDRPIDSGDLDRLIELGWRQAFVDCGEESFTAEHYDDSASWACYT